MLEEVFPFAKIHGIDERPHEVRSVPPQAFTRCGLAWGKRLSWQTQGGQGEKSELFEHPTRGVFCSRRV